MRFLLEHNLKAFLLVVLLVILAPSSRAGWVPVGPFGGDVRALAIDPHDTRRMYLGTRTGQIFSSTDAGRSWGRIQTFSAPTDWVVDSLVVDPTSNGTVYAGLWSLQGETGGVFKTVDAGATWRELPEIKGQSVRALAMAPSSSRVLVAGSIQGVFRSDDAGTSWRRISPAGHKEIFNVESIAIDPVRPNIIYAGTWHLPWKTIDGGAHWASIKKGIIDDSDVFSIVIDRDHPQTLYASACSGIYRSDSAGDEWKKIQGIPYTSRRTRVLMLDPRSPGTLWAGTTEGLWRTKNGGESWSRLSHHTWVINAVTLDPSDENHVFLGMDHFGVMESRDAGALFYSSNFGFAQRQVSSIVPDPVAPGHFYAALSEEGESNAVVATEDNGITWTPIATGLDGRGVLTLLLSTEPKWRLLAGTVDGLFEYDKDKSVWTSTGKIQLRTPLPPGTNVNIWKLYRRSDKEPIYAASSVGLLGSNDGENWRRLPLDAPRRGVTSVAVGGTDGSVIVAATETGPKVSRDAGQSWSDLRIEGEAKLVVQKVASDPSRSNILFLGSSSGLFRSTDSGQTWERFGHGVPASSIQEIYVEPNHKGTVVVASSAGIFQSSDGGATYSRVSDGPIMAGLPIQLLSLHPKSLLPIVAASAFNGMFAFDGLEEKQSLPRLTSAERYLRQFSTQ